MKKSAASIKVAKEKIIAYLKARPEGTTLENILAYMPLEWREGRTIFQPYPKKTVEKVLRAVLQLEAEKKLRMTTRLVYDKPKGSHWEIGIKPSA